MSIALRRPGGKLPGLGHTLHSAVDPRVVILRQVAEETGFAGRHIARLDAAAVAAEESLGRSLVSKAAGMVGAILSELGYAPRGALISPSNFRRAIELLGPILIQTYGTSEAPHPLTLLRPDDYAADMTEDLLRSAGFPAPAVSLRVVDSNGEDVARGQDGELLIRAPSVMLGYWRRPEATSEVLDGSGWYHTGDIVSISDAGAATFRDRKRDLVITGGMNVYPTEVERVLEENPEIAMAAVVG